jgi:SAM-dependent methyltransferase
MAHAMPSIHGVAASGFTADGAQLYHKGRPDWQLNHVREMLSLANVTPEHQEADVEKRVWPKAPVLEIAAGTGKYTRPLLIALQELCPEGYKPNLLVTEPTGFAVAIADLIESKQIRFLPTKAEEMGEIESGSCCVAIAAQAFHWFTTDEAVTEIMRCLKPKAAFVACWNGRSSKNELGAITDPAEMKFVTEHEAIIDSSYQRGTPRYQARKWEVFARQCPLFVQPSPELHLWGREGGGHIGTAEELLAATLSISEIARRPADERANYEEKLKAVIAEAPKLADGRIRMPTHTEVALMWKKD